MKFQLEITYDEKVIAKKLLTSLYEMNSSQISISRSCGDYFYKFQLSEVQINLHFG